MQEQGAIGSGSTAVVPILHLRRSSCILLTAAVKTTLPLPLTFGASGTLPTMSTFEAGRDSCFSSCGRERSFHPTKQFMSIIPNLERANDHRSTSIRSRNGLDSLLHHDVFGRYANSSTATSSFDEVRYFNRRADPFPRGWIQGQVNLAQGLEASLWRVADGCMPVADVLSILGYLWCQSGSSLPLDLQDLSRVKLLYADGCMPVADVLQ